MTISNPALVYIIGAAVIFVFLIAAWSLDKSDADRTGLVIGATLMWPITALIIAGVFLGAAIGKGKQ